MRCLNRDVVAGSSHTHERVHTRGIVQRDGVSAARDSRGTTILLSPSRTERSRRSICMLIRECLPGSGPLNNVMFIQR